MAEITAEKMEIRLPNGETTYEQDQEWCEVIQDGEEPRRIRFHDYHELYVVPGLYERLFYEELECDSPRVVTGLLEEQLEADDRSPSELNVLDVGAGNGIVGEHLQEIGASTITGVDIIEEAAEAAERDRPKVYDDYFVVDLTDIPAKQKAELEQQDFNCLVSVAALGFGDMPPDAFSQAYNFVEDDGMVAFSIKEEMVNGSDSSGFSRLIDRGLAEGALELKASRRYRHRLSCTGEPIHYVAMVAEKKAELPLAE